MITISANTEPVISQLPVPALANEPFIPNKDEENPETSPFAELLAGMLQNTEKNQDISHTYSDAEKNTDSSGIEGLNFDGNSNLFANAKNIIDIPDIDFSDIEIPEEYLGVLLNTQHLMDIDHLESVAGIDADDFQTELSNIEIAYPQEAEILPDFSESDFMETTSVSQTASAFQTTSAVSSVKDEKEANAALAANVMQNAEESLQDSNNESLIDEHILNELASKERTAGTSSKNENNETLSANVRSEEGVNEKTDRLDERGRSRRDRIAFEVRDLRSGEASRNNTGTSSFAAVETSTGRSGIDAPIREITLELRLPDQNSMPAGQNAQTTWEAKAAGTGNIMENLLARELHQNFNGDIVRHASMVLRNGGEGTIRLALKPESLGNVKIHLEMSENKITGRIFVESEEALNAFRKEIASLEQAFRDSGFTNADLNLSLSWNGQNANGSEQEADAFTPRMIASRYDSYAEGDTLNMVDVLIGHNSGSINMFA